MFRLFSLSRVSPRVAGCTCPCCVLLPLGSAARLRIRFQPCVAWWIEGTAELVLLPTPIITRTAVSVIAAAFHPTQKTRPPPHARSRCSLAAGMPKERPKAGPTVNSHVRRPLSGPVPNAGASRALRPASRRQRLEAPFACRVREPPPAPGRTPQKRLFSFFSLSCLHFARHPKSPLDMAAEHHRQRQQRQVSATPPAAPRGYASTAARCRRHRAVCGGGLLRLWAAHRTRSGNPRLRGRTPSRSPFAQERRRRRDAMSSAST